MGTDSRRAERLTNRSASGGSIWARKMTKTAFVIFVEKILPPEAPTGDTGTAAASTGLAARPGANTSHKPAPQGAPLDHITAGIKTFGPVRLRRGEVDGTRTRDPRRDRPIL
jgi:hypothetical protein